MERRTLATIGLGISLASGGFLFGQCSGAPKDTRPFYERYQDTHVKHYSTGIREKILQTRSEYQNYLKAKDAKTGEFLLADAVPAEIRSALNCDAGDEARAHQIDINNDGVYELQAWCAGWLGASGDFYAELFADDGGWKSMMAGGRPKIGDEIVNGRPVLYDETTVHIGSGPQVETGVTVATKYVFNGSKYEKAMSFIPREQIARRIAEMRSSGMPQEDRRLIVEGLQSNSNDYSFLDGALRAYGVDANDPQQITQSVDALIDNLGLNAQMPDIDFQIAMATRNAIMSSPASIAAYFAGRVVHHATADAWYKKETMELAESYPKIDQFIVQHGRLPDPDERHALMRDNYSAIPEAPPSPFTQGRDTIMTERSRDGLTERHYFSPGATPEQARQQYYNMRQERSNEQARQNWQQGTQQVQQDAGRAVDAGRQAVGNIIQQLQKAAQPEKKKD